MRVFFIDIIIILILIGAGLIGGYLLGKNSVKIEEKTEVAYQVLPTITISIAPEPFKISIPYVPQFLYFTDTITDRPIIDTVVILADWILKREYAGRLIDDSTGTMDYSAIIQYNKLQNISLDYTPFQRNVITTRIIQQKIIPFVFIGSNSAGFSSVEVGMFIGQWGLTTEAGTNFAGTNYIGGKIGIKF
jgi:hypothetical protein